MSQPNPQIVFVLGMHRSGTSALTCGLAALGVDLGDRLMDPVPGNNDKGFFEDLDIFAINEEIFKVLNDASWSSLQAIDPDDLRVRSLDSLKVRASHLLRSKHESSPIFAVKDPRFAKVLPFWLDVVSSLNLSPSFIISLRNPLSVAHSLQKRDQLDEIRSHYLWLQHLLLSIKLTSNLPRLVVDYDLFMADALGQLSRVAKFLNLEFNPDTPQLSEFKNVFLDSSLRHHQHEVDEMSSDLSLPVGLAEFFVALRNVALDRASLGSEKIQSLIEHQLQILKGMQPIFRSMDHSDSRFHKLKKEYDSDRDEVIEAKRLVAKKESERIALDRQISELRDWISDSKARMAYLTSLTVDQRKQIEALKQQTENLENQLRGILGSRSWRITKPLRGLRRIAS